MNLNIEDLGISGVYVNFMKFVLISDVTEINSFNGKRCICFYCCVRYDTTYDIYFTCCCIYLCVFVIISLVTYYAKFLMCKYTKIKCNITILLIWKHIWNHIDNTIKDVLYLLTVRNSFMKSVILIWSTCVCFFDFVCWIIYIQNNTTQLRFFGNVNPLNIKNRIWLFFCIFKSSHSHEVTLRLHITFLFCRWYFLVNLTVKFILFHSTYPAL